MTGKFPTREFASENNTVESEAYKIHNFRHIFLVAEIAGLTLDGDAKVQVSVNGGTEWADVAGSNQALPASGGNLYWEITTAAPLIRLSVTTDDTNEATVSLSGFGKN